MRRLALALMAGGLLAASPDVALTGAGRLVQAFECADARAAAFPPTPKRRPAIGLTLGAPLCASGRENR